MRKPASDKALVASSLERAQAAQRRGAWRRAIAVYEEVLSEHPDRADVRLKLADLYARHHRHDAAYGHYQRTADHYLKLGYKERAVAVFLVAARRVPSQPESYRRAAELELERGHRQNGARFLRESARVLRRLRRDEDAVTLLRQAFSLEPFSIETSLQLSESLRRTGRRQEARSLIVRLAFEKRDVRLRWELVRCAPSVGTVFGFLIAAVR